MSRNNACFSVSLLDFDLNRVLTSLRSSLIIIGVANVRHSHVFLLDAQTYSKQNIWKTRFSQVGETGASSASGHVWHMAKFSM